MNIPSAIKVDLWPGPLTTDPTFEPTSGYSESFWTAIVGPTALVAARKLYVRAKLGVYEQDLAVLAHELGLVNRFGDPSPSLAKKALNRLCRFHLAKFSHETGVFGLRSQWPLLNTYQVERLPAHLQRLARPPERLREVG